MNDKEQLAKVKEFKNKLASLSSQFKQKSEMTSEEQSIAFGKLQRIKGDVDAFSCFFSLKSNVLSDIKEVISDLDSTVANKNLDSFA